MLIRVVFILCLLYTLTSGQTNTTANRPTLGEVYTVPNNDTVLNFTFIYPKNYTFDKLYVRFTLYDFIGHDTSNPQIYRFQYANFTNNNISLPWVVPPAPLVPGDYIIGCFEWVQANSLDQILADLYQCKLARTTMNSTVLPIVDIILSAPVVTNISITIATYYPMELPYDQVEISAVLNDTIMPSSESTNNNSTYTSMDVFSFTNLTSNTVYNLCIYMDYLNSKINGTQQMDSRCQIIQTFGSSLSTTTATATTTNTAATTTNTTATTTNTAAATTTTTTRPSSCNKMKQNINLIILLICIFILF